MSKTYKFPLDHFGIVASSLIAQLTTQTGDKRKRKSALRALHQMAKSTKQIQKEDTTIGAGLYIDAAGQIWLFLETEAAEAKLLAATPKHTFENAPTDSPPNSLQIMCKYCAGDISYHAAEARYLHVANRFPEDNGYYCTYEDAKVAKLGRPAFYAEPYRQEAE